VVELDSGHEYETAISFLRVQDTGRVIYQNGGEDVATQWKRKMTIGTDYPSLPIPPSCGRGCR